MIPAKKIAFLACRLFSLYTLYLLLQHLGFAVVPVVQAFRADVAVTPLNLFDLLYPSLSLTVFDLLAFLFLWYGANWISGMMTGDAEEDTQQEDWSRSTFLSMAVAILGLVILITTIPRVAGFFYMYASFSSVSYESLVQYVVAIGLGIGCSLGHRAIADFIVKVRRW